MRYKLIIFDFDGTLADSFPFFLRAFGEAVERFGLRRVAPDELESLRRRSAREIISYLRIPFWKIPSIARFVRRRMVALPGQIKLFDGVEGMLSQLASAGCVISIVSSNSEANIRSILGPDISRLIIVYECGASLFGKARRFRRVLKRTGLKPSDAVCIGDELRDHEAARKEGIAFGGVSWGYTDAGAMRTAAPDILFTGPAEIGSVLLSS